MGKKKLVLKIAKRLSVEETKIYLWKKKIKEYWEIIKLKIY